MSSAVGLVLSIVAVMFGVGLVCLAVIIAAVIVGRIARRRRDGHTSNINIRLHHAPPPHGNPAAPATAPPKTALIVLVVVRIILTQGS